MSWQRAKKVDRHNAAESLGGLGVPFGQVLGCKVEGQ